MKTQRPDPRLTMAVVSVLLEHRGIERRIRRDSLREELGWRYRLRVSDREMRAAIEAARATPKGALVCSTTTGGGGYYMARSTAELDEYLRQDESRCREMWQRCRKQRAAAGIALDAEPTHQMEML
mgnify:FL=1